MNPSLWLDVVEAVGFAILFFAPFSKSRIRARWANSVFFTVSVVGICRTIILILWDQNLIVIPQVMVRELDILGGVLIGLLLSLFISGQISGAKKPKD